MQTKPFFLLQTLLYLCLATFRSPTSIFCQWSTDPMENNYITQGTRWPHLVTDGAGGFIVVSELHATRQKTFAQRVSADGRLLWAKVRGIQVAEIYDRQDFRSGWEYRTHAISDGVGGVYIAFRAGKFLGIGPGDLGEMFASPLYLQRIDSTGRRLFGSAGLRLTPDSPDTVEFTQMLAHMISDGEGGVYVHWEGSLNDANPNAHPDTKFRDYLARVGPDGRFIWGPIVPDSLSWSCDYLPYLDTEKNLNIHKIGWESSMGGAPGDRFLKLDATTGQILLDKKIEIGTGFYGFSSGFSRYAQADGGSAIFVFNGFRSDSLQIQKLDSDGNKLWGEEPVMITTEPLRPHSYFSLVYDHTGGAYVWYVLKANQAIHLVHISSAGQVEWLRVFEKIRRPEYKINTYQWPSIYHNPPVIAAQEKSPAVFVFQDIFQRLVKLDMSGNTLWETQYSRRLTRDDVAHYAAWSAYVHENGDIAVVWWEIGDGVENFHGLRGQRISRDGQIGVISSIRHSDQSLPAPRTFELKSILPNPFQQQTRIHVSLATPQTLALKIYNLLGKEVRTLVANRRLAPGTHRFDWDGRGETGAALPSGIYFIVVHSSFETASRKIVLIR